MNYFKTFLLMTGLLALMMFVRQAVGGSQGAMSFLFIGLAINFVSYWFSDKIVLMTSGAKAATEEELPQVYAIVRKLTQQQNMPMPKIYLMDTPMLNAFATGRNPEHAAVAVTSGILRALNQEELTGVLGHELSHVKHRDILISTIAAAIAGAIMMVSRMAMWFGPRGDNDNRGNPAAMIAIMILAPLAATIIQLAISRSREYAADEGGADMTGTPLALASALKKLQAGAVRNPMEVAPATAHLFIVSPFTARSMMSLFSTHPPVEERVRRLEAIADQRSSGPANKIIY